MSSHKKRMQQIGRFALPTSGSMEREVFDAWVKATKEDPRITGFAQTAWQHARELVLIQQENGAGLPLDELLRSFHLEYNSRTVQHGLTTMPSSFNVNEAFFEYLPPLTIFSLRPERDHIFSLDEFLDFVIGGEAALDVSGGATLLEDGVVYSYLNSDSPRQMTFSVSPTKTFGVGGVSIVKHADELSMLLLAGEMIGSSEAVEPLDEWKALITPGKEGIQPDPTLMRHQVRLFDIPDLWQVLVLTRFHLEEHIQEVRYVLYDQGNSYWLITDDASTFFGQDGKPVVSDAVETLHDLSNRIKAYAALFEVCKTFVLLPLFFDEREEDVTEERHRTKYGNRSRPERRRLKNEWPTHERVVERRVAVMRSNSSVSGATRTVFQAPTFRIEASGYWKKLPHGHLGADKLGRPVHEKTWVEKRLSWHEQEAASASLFTVAEHADRGHTSGRLYVMRSAMHPKDVFKVGHTTRSTELRAAEVSKGSGVPDKLFTMYEWDVEDSALVERLVHERIAAFRLSSIREFFQLPLKDLVTIIDEVIGTTESVRSSNPL